MLDAITTVSPTSPRVMRTAFVIGDTTFFHFVKEQTDLDFLTKGQKTLLIQQCLMTPVLTRRGGGG